MSYAHGSSYWPIKSMQVNLLGGDSAEASALVTYAGRDWPVYVAGSGGISGRALTVDFSEATVAGMSVPANYLDAGEAYLESLVNGRLGRIPGFDIQTLEITEEGVHAVGSIWESAEWVPVAE